MIVSCDNCTAQYRLDPEKLSTRGARVNCRRCKHVFVIYPDSGSTAPAATASLDVDALDFRKVGIQAWRVKVKIGLVYDFSDYRTLAKYIQEGRVEASDLLSHDGENWTAINQIDDLAGHFVDIYERAERGELQPASSAPPPKGPRTSPRAALDSGVDGLDMEIDTDELTGPTMSDLVASAMEEVDDDVTATLPVAAKAGAGSPRFVDPFEALRARQVAQNGVRRGNGAAAGRPADGADKKGPPVALLACIGLAIVGLLVMALSPEEADPKAAAQQAQLKQEQKIQRSEIEAARKSKDKRAKLNRELAALAEEVTDEDVAFIPDLPPEEQLVPVVPAEFRDGGSMDSAAMLGTTTPAPDAATVARDAMSQGDWDAAATAWRKALTSGNDPIHREQLGVALYHSKRTTQAAMELNRATAMGVVSAHKWLGHLARDQGDAGGAMSHYNTYLRTNPPDRAQIEREIIRLGGG